MITEEPDVTVNFFPHLYLQRRIWVLNVLRREGTTSILDIGCGEGELLQALCQPAPWLQPPSETSEEHVALHKNEILNLHPTRVFGLDVSVDDLQVAIANTAPFEDFPRWEPVEAKIWEGGLEVFNPSFVDMECIVAMEVVEHLHKDIVLFFAPMILGVYHPRQFLMTTPSYTFNARFAAPGVIRRSGYPDPTGRTDRVFRHPDHKFEWTVEEFEEYCSTAAKQWGYEVKCSTIGYAMDKDEWGRDEELGGASQVAEFRRLEGEEYATMRAEVSKKWIGMADEKPQHRLLAVRQHPAHPNAKCPRPVGEIGEAVKALMDESREVFMRIENIWFAREIAVMCGGWIELLTQAVEEHERLRLHKEDERKRGTWRVELIGGIHGPTLEEMAREEEIAQDYFPEVSGEWEAEAWSVSGPQSTSTLEAGEEVVDSPIGWESSDRWGGEGRA